ncbi:MAG: type III-A CRISPR-associated RAMP protein Csm3 [Sulfolobales archaeon]
MTTEKMYFTRRLTGYAVFTLRFVTKTGLLIQAPIQAQAYKIGGADKYPMTTRKRYRDAELEVPYVPGSSIKGRLRSLLELATNQKLYTTDYKIWQYFRSLTAMKVKEFIDDVNSRNVISELFGWAAANFKQVVDELVASKEVDLEKAKRIAYETFQLLSTTRLLFSDFHPAADYIEKAKVTSIADLLEEKPENRIDRVTAAADPRTIVRVKPGVIFEGVVTMLLFDHDKHKIEEFLETFVAGLKLLEDTYLGSSGSRGYGRVEFVGKSVDVFKISPEQLTSSGILSKIDTIEFTSLEDLRTKTKLIKEALQKLYT